MSLVQENKLALSFASIAAAVAVSALMTAPAGAAELRVNSPTTPVVHISLAGKTTAQVNTEIKAAANTVCGTWNGACISEAISDAQDQYAAITRMGHKVADASGANRLNVSRTGPTTIRVSLKGKTSAQIESEVQTAVQTVCKSTNPTFSDYRACVEVTDREAHSRLRQIAQADQASKLASN